MTLMKTESIGFYGSSSGADISLRRFFRTFGQVQGFPIEVLFDPDSTEIQISIPYNEVEDEDRGIISRERAEDTVAVHLNGPFGYYQNYYVMGSHPSGTAPDRFWVFDLVRDPFYWLEKAPEYPLGRWSATQNPNDSGLTFAVEGDAMKPSRSVELPRIGHIYGQATTQTDAYIVKISTTDRVSVDDSGHVTKKTDTPTTYYTICNSQYSGYIIISPSGRGFVSIDEIVANIDALSKTSAGETFGFTADSIVDISISARSPFEINIYPLDPDLMDIGTSSIYPLKHDSLYIKDGFEQSIGPEQEIPFTLSDMEYYTGQVMLFDENDSPMAHLPVQTLPRRPDDDKMKIRTVSDMTGIYTELTFAGSHIIMPEGKLPYVGSTWETYAATQKSYDRENMNLAVQNAKSEAIQSALTGTAEGMLTGALIAGPLGLAGGIATAGLNLAGTAISTSRNIDTIRAQQESKEKMMQAAPGTAFNTGYGLEYLRKANAHRGRIQMNMPAHLTQARYDSYVQEHGYPDSGVEHAQNLFAPGYVQGYVTGPSIPKYRRDEMNRYLTQGVRFI